MKKLKLWYRTPAKTFSQALPLGNGSFGAMVYGDFPDFHYSLNADTLWSGTGWEKREHVRVSEEELALVRKLIGEKKYYEAEQVVQERMTGKTYNESYVSPGTLWLRFAGKEPMRELYRELCLDNACGKTIIDTGNNQIEIRSFLSCTEGVLVTEICSEMPVSFRIEQKSMLPHDLEEKEGMLILCGEAPSHVEPNYAESRSPILFGGGMRYSIVTGVKTDGTCGWDSGGITLAKSTRCLLCTALETGYRGFRKPLEKSQEKLVSLCADRVKAAMEREIEWLAERHTRVFEMWYGRVSFWLEGKEQNLPLDEQLRSFCGEELALYPLLFQYGRYLLLCSSMPSGPYVQPGNLQGIWCEDIRPMWSCNMTVNINTEMNYWLAGPCGLSECEEPLIRMLEEIRQTGEETARETFRTGGWAACHNIDLWRQTTPVKGKAKWAYWPMGGVWLATHLYRHYQFTDDREFLENQAYPVMAGSARFCLDWLYEENGYLHSSPSTSPENTFLDDKRRECAVCDSSTMDISLIREILAETRETAKILKKDRAFMEELEEALQKLPEYGIGKYGQLLEWPQDPDEADPHHRHFAHLVGLHPFHQIDQDSRSKLLEAAETVLRRRTKGASCFIGWVEAWLVNFYARLKKGAEANRHLNLFLKHCAYENLFSLHPPLGQGIGERKIFQIDGNLGITEGIREMLLFTKPGKIILLPALPDSWRKGRIAGLVCCGGHRISIDWEEGVLSCAKLWPRRQEVLTVCYKLPFCAEAQDGRVWRSYLSGQEERIFLEVQEGEEIQFHNMTGGGKNVRSDIENRADRLANSAAGE